jgi:hypothetical protein
VGHIPSFKPAPIFRKPFESVESIKAGSGVQVMPGPPYKGLAGGNSKFQVEDFFLIEMVMIRDGFIKFKPFLVVSLERVIIIDEQGTLIGFPDPLFEFIKIPDKEEQVIEWRQETQDACEEDKILEKFDKTKFHAGFGKVVKIGDFRKC